MFLSLESTDSDQQVRVLAGAIRGGRAASGSKAEYEDGKFFFLYFRHFPMVRAPGEFRVPASQTPENRSHGGVFAPRRVSNLDRGPCIYRGITTRESQRVPNWTDW